MRLKASVFALFLATGYALLAQSPQQSVPRDDAFVSRSSGTTSTTASAGTVVDAQSIKSHSLVALRHHHFFFPRNSAIRAFTSRVTSADGSGASSGNRMVPLPEVSYPLISAASARVVAALSG